jgi:hypothetical protein
MEGRLALRNVLLVGFVLATVALYLWLVVDTETEVQAQAECPSPRLIDEITGSGDQQTAPFETTTDSFRISYEITADLEEAVFYANVESTDEGLLPGAGISQEGSGTGESFVNEPPGRYFLSIITGGSTEYTIRIEECGEGGEANPGEGQSGQGTTSPKTNSPAPKKAATPPKTPSPAPKTPSPYPPPPPSSGSLMKAGGPELGPVPVMPNGSCPQEFPERRGNACYG